jgi:hypothetical protein
MLNDLRGCDSPGGCRLEENVQVPIGYLPPAEYEARYYQQAAVA